MSTTTLPTSTSIGRASHATSPVAIRQYSKTAVFGIWAAAALPMALLAWVIAPSMADALSGGRPLARALLITLTAGLAWQAVLAFGLVAHEQGSLRWSVLRQAMWLQSPRSPRSGRIGGRVWLIVIPLIIAFALEGMIPDLAPVASHDLATFLGEESGQTLLQESILWPALLFGLLFLNTVVGEELLFRGVLLPRMAGAFGRADWVMNGVLFAVYHLHMPWVIPAALLDMFIISYPVKRYRSAWIGIIVHSAQSVVVGAVVISLLI